MQHDFCALAAREQKGKFGTRVTHPHITAWTHDRGSLAAPSWTF